MKCTPDPKDFKRMLKPSLESSAVTGLKFLADRHRMRRLAGFWIFFLGQFFCKGAAGRVA